jgi:putative adhesin
MIGMLAALTLAALTGASSQTDTTFAVKPGTRLEVNQFAGSIAVDTWSKNAVHVVASHSSRVEIEFGGSWPSLTIDAVHMRGLPSTVDYQLTVPKWMALNLSGVNTEMTVDNSAGEIQIETVQGEVTVTGGSKTIQASSVDGAVHLMDATGRIECNSVNGTVEIERSSGPIAASSVNGEIVLKSVDSDDVDGSTVNGTVNYDGAIKADGSYRLSSHNGEVSIAIPERASATVSVATYSGDFSSDFPVPLTENRHGKRFSFTLGGGSARIELESFQGGIHLRRPGNPEGRGSVEYRYEEKTKEKTKETTKSKTKVKNSGEGEVEP